VNKFNVGDWQLPRKELTDKGDDWDKLGSCNPAIQRQETHLGYLVAGWERNDRQQTSMLWHLARKWKQQHPIIGIAERSDRGELGWIYRVKRYGLPGQFLVFERDPFYELANRKII